MFGEDFRRLIDQYFFRRRQYMREVRLGSTDCRPEETGYDSSRLEVLHKHFDKLIDEGVINGAQYTIAHKGKIIANGAIGGGSFTDDKALMQTDMPFGLASITKTFVAVSIMKLVEDGVIRLEQRMGEFIDVFGKKPFDGINIWHMLTHTSGLYPDGGCFPEVTPEDHWSNVYKDYLLTVKNGGNPDEIDWIASGIKGGLRRPTGTEWAYCSFGYVILGELIRKVTGVSPEEYIINNIVKPLGMEDTFFPGMLSDSDAVRFMKRMYVRGERFQKLKDQVLAEGKMPEKDDEDKFFDRLPATAGGMISTTHDLSIYGRMLLGKGTFGGVRVIGRKAVEKMTSHQLFNIPDYCWGANEPDRGYGIGFDMRKGLPWTYSDGTFMHEGSGSCSIDIDPVEDIVAAWFVPWKDGQSWNARGLYNVQNIIWSGLK
jgi:CubicO group peptidase (beta-lactamase class C family)